MDNREDLKIVGNAFQEQLQKIRSVLIVVFIFSFCSNITMLLTPLYSLQVLDRVIGSQNLHTLLMLSLIIGFIYLVYGLIQVARSFVLIKLAEWMEVNIAPVVFAHSISASAVGRNLSGAQALRDFQSVKGFLTSAGINTIFDMPWTIAYVTAVFMIHPYMGWVTVVSAIITIGFSLFNAVATTKYLGESNELNNRSLQNAEIATRNAETIESMGMIKAVSANWLHYARQALSFQMLASNRNTVISNTSRYLRNVAQMCITASGAYAVLTSQGAMTTGGMIAGSILFGRALAPFDSFIEVWKNIVQVRKAYKRLNDNFKSPLVMRDSNMNFKDISGSVVVSNVVYAHPVRVSSPLHAMSKPKEVLQDVSFSVEPGRALAIMGPSGSGKTTLSKVIVGVWRPIAGNVTLDKVDTYRWDREDFGKHVGYMPQGVELFSGSVKQNIARMQENPDLQMIQNAAKLVDAHEFILSLPQGYDTDIGTFGANLSGGQKQKIALARAFYGNPKLVVLDEPNANLDRQGDEALCMAIKFAKEAGITVIIVSHRHSALEHVDDILYLQNGKVKYLGQRDEVIAILLSEMRKTDAK